MPGRKIARDAATGIPTDSLSESSTTAIVSA
jgi:hypothetical protein